MIQLIMFKNRHKKSPRGWEKEANEYHELVGERGHYYHQHVVIPGTLALLNLKKGDAVLDLGCGQGVLARAIARGVSYVGVDSSRSLVDFAAKIDRDPHHTYIEASCTRPIKNVRKDFTHSTFILSLQNMEYASHAIKNASEHLVKNGRLIIVLNHPAFRIPRQSGWLDPSKQSGGGGMQSRWVNRYMSYLKIPISMHPGKKGGATTTSYHVPISRYSQWLFENGFVIEKLEEWTSDKKSKGKAAKMENRARDEFPLFMAILAQKM